MLPEPAWPEQKALWSPLPVSLMCPSSSKRMLQQGRKSKAVTACSKSCENQHGAEAAQRCAQSPGGRYLPLPAPSPRCEQDRGQLPSLCTHAGCSTPDSQTLGERSQVLQLVSLQRPSLVPLPSQGSREEPGACQGWLLRSVVHTGCFHSTAEPRLALPPPTCLASGHHPALPLCTRLCQWLAAGLGLGCCESRPCPSSATRTSLV